MTTYQSDLRELVLEDGEVLDEEVPLYVFCPLHKDTRRPSLAVYYDHAYCYTCAEFFTRKRFSENYSEIEKTSAFIKSENIRRVRRPRQEVDPRAVACAAHTLLRRNQEKLDWLYARGLNDSTIDAWQLGHNGPAYTLPVFEGGEIVTVRFRRDDVECPFLDKYWGLVGYNSTMLYGIHPGSTLPVAVMTEGEFDALLLWQHGIPAFSLTNGDKSWRKLNWIAPLERVQRLILCRDQDVAGKTATEGLIDAVHEALPTLIIHPLGWNCQGKDVTELWQLNPRGFALLVERLHTIMELP